MHNNFTFVKKTPNRDKNIENHFETIMNSPFDDGFNLIIRKNSFKRKFCLHNNGCITWLGNFTCKMNLIENN
jgi:hypothetical protein